MQKKLNMEIKTKMTKNQLDLLLSLVFKIYPLFFSSEFKIINKIIRTTTFPITMKVNWNLIFLVVSMYEH